MKSLLFCFIAGLTFFSPAVADQFVLFEETFTFEEKGAKGDGKSHAGLQPDLKNYFPTRIRVSMIPVSSGSIYDPVRGCGDQRGREPMRTL